MASTIGGTTGVTFPDGTTQSTAATTPTAVANLSGGAAGKIPYQSAADTTGFSAVGTSGQPLVSGGTGAPAFRPYTLPASDGTNGQVLQTNGSGTLSFATPSSGAFVYLATYTASASTTLDIESFTSTYQTYLIVASKVYLDSSGSDISVNLKIDGSYKTNPNYYFHSANPSSDGTTYSAIAGAGDVQIIVAQPDPGAQNAMDLYMYISQPSNNGTYLKNIRWTGTCNRGTAICSLWGSGRYAINSTSGGKTPLTGIRFYNNNASATFTGTFYVYGIKNS